MPGMDYAEIGLKVGLEVHQQLATGTKLFCKCRQLEAATYSKKFSRKLRASKSEMGQYDPASVFETSKSKGIIYYSNPESSCLVEEDEEPPHDVGGAAKDTALIIALALNSKIFREIFPMRKMVIDGSNTSGFQRTMLIAQGGQLTVGEIQVGVQSICLEEDAAKLLKDEGESREYGLDRLGVPLVEIALEPVEAGPGEMRQVALTLGRLLRTTGMAVRGLGSIRQDVNVSVRGGQVIEVKGVQQLDQLEKVVEFEAKRQEGLRLIAERLQKSGADGEGWKVLDVTDAMAGCKSKTVRATLDGGSRMCAILAPGFEGSFAYSPYEGVRLGKEMAQLVKRYGIGGVFHSDELPSYGITDSDVTTIKELLGAGKGDGFVMVALPPSKYTTISERMVDRMRRALDGVCAETRLAREDGETVFLRPRPGPSRMYPETDVPPITVSADELDKATKAIPMPWDKSVADLGRRHGLNVQLAEQLLDSEYAGLFEKICACKIPPNFAASALCSTITSLRRKGLDGRLLTEEHILDTFAMLGKGSIGKESVAIIFEEIMSGKAKTIDEALGAGPVSDDELERILDGIVADNSELIRKQGAHSVGALMGIAMNQLRGRVPGEKISRLLAEKISVSDKK